MRKGEFMKILGIPFGEDFDDQEFLEKKYSDMKRLIAAWKDHGKVTAFGRAMLANSMIFSRFRYYAQSMRLSDALMDAIEADAQALVWARDENFDAAEFGTDVPDVSKRTRWVEPLASFDKTGHFKWNDDLVAELEKLGKAPNSS